MDESKVYNDIVEYKRLCLEYAENASNDIIIRLKEIQHEHSNIMCLNECYNGSNSYGCIGTHKMENIIFDLNCILYEAIEYEFDELIILFCNLCDEEGNMHYKLMDYIIIFAKAYGFNTFGYTQIANSGDIIFYIDECDKFNEVSQYGILFKNNRNNQ